LLSFPQFHHEPLGNPVIVVKTSLYVGIGLRVGYGIYVKLRQLIDFPVFSSQIFFEREVGIPTGWMIFAIDRPTLGLMAHANAVVRRLFAFVTTIRALPNLLENDLILAERASFWAGYIL
jgi:hypothetical protein